MPKISSTPIKGYVSGTGATTTSASTTTTTPRGYLSGPNVSKFQPYHYEYPSVVTPPKEYVFHDPLPLRDQNFEYETLSANAMCSPVLLPDPKRTFEDQVKDLSIPWIVFTATLYREIRYITESIPNSEYALFLMLRRMNPNKPHFLAYDFFMPGQEASAAGVNLDGVECKKYFDRLKEVEYYKENGLHRHIGHLHSHASFGVFWSAVDDEQQLSKNDLGFADDFRFYVVVNAKGDIKASLVGYSPVLYRVDAGVAISYARPEYIEGLGKARMKELDAIREGSMRTSAYSANIKGEHAVTAVSEKTTKYPSKYEYDYLYDSPRDGYGRGHYGYKYGNTTVSQATTTPASKPNPNGNIGRTTTSAAEEAAIVQSTEDYDLREGAVEPTTLEMIDKLSRVFLKHAGEEFIHITLPPAKHADEFLCGMEYSLAVSNDEDLNDTNGVAAMATYMYKELSGKIDEPNILLAAMAAAGELLGDCALLASYYEETTYSEISEMITAGTCSSLVPNPKSIMSNRTATILAYWATSEGEDAAGNREEAIVATIMQDITDHLKEEYN